MSAEPVFDVSDLRVAIMDPTAPLAGATDTLFVEPYGPVLGPEWRQVVHGIDFSLRPGEVLAIVGESGSGKSLTAMGSLGLLTPTAKVVGGTVRFGERTLRPTRQLEQSRQRWWRRLRKKPRKRFRFMEELLDDDYRDVMGTEIGVLFQDPVTSWTPIDMIGRQAQEALDEHTELSRADVTDRVLQALGEVQLPKMRSFTAYRHELSRGQAQRAMLASALVTAPSLLVADEPLSGLDASVGMAVLQLIKDMQEKRQMAVVLITHDLSTVAQVADRVMVMYLGRVVEEGPVTEIFRSPRHPYTEGLLGSIPWPGVDRLRPIEGSPPKITTAPTDECGFASRCPYATVECLEALPILEPIGSSQAACVHKEVIALRGISR